MKCACFHEEKLSKEDKRKLNWILDELIKEKLKTIANKQKEDPEQNNTIEIDPVLEVTDNEL